MSAKKGFELLKNIAAYCAESEGFDRMLKGVRSAIFNLKILKNENISVSFYVDLKFLCTLQNLT